VRLHVGSGIRRLPAGVGPALTAQVFVAASNMAAGIVLARGLSLPDRGIAAVASVMIAVAAVIGCCGAPELMLRVGRQQAHFTRSGQVTVAACVVLTSLTMPLVLRALGSSAPLSSELLLSLVSLLSALNAVENARLFKMRGLAQSVAVRLAYSVLVSGSLWIWYARSDSLSLGYVFATWLSAEILVLLFLLLLRRRRLLSSSVSDGVATEGAGRVRRDDSRAELDARLLLRDGLAHSLSQLGTALADRGAVLLVAPMGLGGAAYVSVAQSASAPISMPVQALTSAILAESHADLKSRRNSKAALWATGLAAVVGSAAIPLVALPLYGAAYSELASYWWLIVGVGVCSAVWRLKHIQMRGMKVPYRASLSDALALASGLLGGVVVLQFSPGFVSASLLVLGVYATCGAASAWFLESRTRRRRLRDGSSASRTAVV